MLKYLKQNYMLYLLLVPGFVYIVIFNILPLIGIIMAFTDFDLFAVPGAPLKSLFCGSWAGFKYFAELFSHKDFLRALLNTFIISAYKIIFIFPLPIMLAVLLNEVKSSKFKSRIQLIVYMPHFLSWVVVSGIFFSLLSSNGIINNILDAAGIARINFLIDSATFRGVLVVSEGWKELGFSSIIYLAAIAGIEKERFEAAEVDGAGILQKTLHITIPGIMPAIVLMLVIRMGGIMDAGFGQILVMYNPTVYDVSDIIGTYVFRRCLGKLAFSVGTAAGIFNSVMAILFAVCSNYMAKRFLGKGIW